MIFKFSILHIGKKKKSNCKYDPYETAYQERDLSRNEQ